MEKHEHTDEGMVQRRREREQERESVERAELPVGVCRVAALIVLINILQKLINNNRI